MNNSKGNNARNRLTMALFIVYLAVLVWIILFKLGVQFSYMESRRVNVIPFKGIITTKGIIGKGEILLNIIIFIPLGIYAGVLLKRQSFGNNIFFFCFISVLFEAFQFIFRIGAFDITDIITNTLGGIMGLLVCKLIEKIFSNSAKAEKFINTIAATGTVIMITLLVLLKLNMLPVRYQ